MYFHRIFACRTLHQINIQSSTSNVRVSVFQTLCTHCTCISLLGLPLYTKRSLFYAPLQHACQNMWSVRNIHTSCFLNSKLLQYRMRVGQKNTISSYVFFTYITPYMLNLAFSPPCIHIGYMG